MRKPAALLVALASCICFSAIAQEKGQERGREKDNVDIDALREQGYSVKMISPIFSQLVMLSFPKGFTTVFEDTSGKQYTREAVLEGETVDKWTQMITVTGAKGLAANANSTAQSFVEQIAGGFKGACPDSFSAKGLGALKISGREAFAALAGCGSVSSDGSEHSEAALIIAIKGTVDYYTIQWAERGPASPRPMVFNDATWTDRFNKLSPIKLCPLMPREAPLYPTCVNQK
jgi:hypothetical protein